MKAESSYAAKDIQVLGELEAVRRRPGMYIGGTDQAGLHHLVYELVDNGVDEAMAGFCDWIEVLIHQNGQVTVSDNGRGIPVEIHPSTGISALQTVFTTLHAGAKFGNQTYKVCGGLHGVGASVVNALSSWFKVEVKRDGKLYCQEFSRGIPLSSVMESDGVEETGTIVSFLPDKGIFPRLSYDFEDLAQRFRETAYLNQGLWIHFRDERQEKETNFYFEGGIVSFVRSLNRKRNVLHHQPIYISKLMDSTSVEIALQYSESFSESTYAFANCINTIDGGTHLTGFRAALTRVLNDYAREHKLIKGIDSNLTGDDVREGLTAVLSIKLLEPQFEGQTKTRLGNPELKNLVEGVVAQGLHNWFEQHPQETKSILGKCLTTARAREAARKARDLVTKRSVGEGGLPGKLTDCSEKNPALREVYIVEGESAGGSAKQGRDRSFQAILPLKGKILNVEKAGPEKMLGHEEIRSIITALGTGTGSQFNVSKLRYHRIILMTDADVDGAHIRTLLLTFFFRHMPQLIEKGHLYIAQPPLYRLKKGRQQRYAYSEEGKEELLSLLGDKKVEIQRYKGLGEMTSEQLWETTLNPQVRVMLQVSIEEAARASQVVEMLLGEQVPPRKAFIQSHAQQVRNLDI